MAASPLDGRRIILGVSGGVAAYKAAILCRELGRRGAVVSPILTRGAQRFVGAATFSAIAAEPARTDLWDNPGEASPHTTVGQAADLVVLAPATAHLLARMRAGLADDLLTTTLLATRAPVLAAPAMHTEMWEHPATRENVAMLAGRGVAFVLPQVGELAGGDVGAGRLADPLEIAAACEALLRPTVRDLTGLHVLVSAGGTREAMDPVRFIGNRSSGKQGHAVARAAAARGATVDLVTTAEFEPGFGDEAIRVTRVTSAQELHDAMLAHAAASDLVVMGAAVADFRPADCADHKLKRRDGLPQIVLEPTPNVLQRLVAERHPAQVVVGFAAETDDVDANAHEKLRSSGADLIVANDVSRADAGFEVDTNAVTIHRATHPDSPIELPLASKQAIAHRILDAVLDARAARVERTASAATVRDTNG